MTAVITVQGLTKGYGDLTAVSDISFEVEEGEIFGILGPNGTALIAPCIRLVIAEPN